jgi:D-alanine-D-alanine ligase-like ATP-grasp enzyme
MLKMSFSLLKTLDVAQSLETENLYHDSRYLSYEDHLHNFMIQQAAEALGFKTERVTGDLFYVKHDVNSIIPFYRLNNCVQPLVENKIIKSKHLAKKVLHWNGLPVPDGVVFKATEYIMALRWARDRMPNIVVKPVDGSEGMGVTVGISNEMQFEDAWNYALENNTGSVVVEEKAKGQAEVRLLVVGGKCISVTGRIPPYAIGDGSSTLQTLVNEKNRRRKLNPGLRNKLAILTKSIVDSLQSQGFLLEGVPDKGQLVILDHKAGLSTGADPIQLVDHIHPGFLHLAEKAAAAFPATVMCGVDVLAEDFARAPEDQSTVILEVNSSPGLSGHHFPTYGRAVDVAGKFVEAVMESVVQLQAIKKGAALQNTVERILNDEHLCEHLEEMLDEEIALKSVSNGGYRRVFLIVRAHSGHFKLLRLVKSHCEEHGLDGSVKIIPSGLKVILRGHKINELVEKLKSDTLKKHVKGVHVMPRETPVKSGFRVTGLFGPIFYVGSLLPLNRFTKR